jgi:DNA-directed RNA polymerase sigma subunit (sigma70/sigma32)
MVEDMLASIDPREAFVLRSIFLDFDGEGTNPYPVVGELIGVGRERVRQIRNEGLASLRRQFGDRVAFEIA